MKNINEQHIKFNRQVNHLSGFIGMPMNGRSLTLSEMRERDRHLLENQAMVFEPKKEGSFKHLFRCLF